MRHRFSNLRKINNFHTHEEISMKFNQIVCAAAMASLLSSSLYADENKKSPQSAVPAPVVGGAIVDITATAVLATGYRATKLLGADIYNKEGDKIGQVDDFIIGSDNNVSFAVISVGGFLGIGNRLVAVPANLFTSNKKGQIVFPNGKKDDLEALPEFKYAK
jgi:sporulation protein YlmC with PRC-barrel domain